MNLLDDLYFYLLDKFLRFSLWVIERIEAETGISMMEDNEKGEDNGKT